MIPFMSEGCHGMHDRSRGSIMERAEDILSWDDWDLFFWLVLTGLTAHVALVLWLCKACWTSFAFQKATIKVYPTGNRIEAGAKWVNGEDFQLQFPSVKGSRGTQGGKGLASLIRRR